MAHLEASGTRGGGGEDSFPYKTVPMRIERYGGKRFPKGVEGKKQKNKCN
jgi:hypothetical protein